MGDRVAVMRKGELQQVADPQTRYDRPVNLFVGGFIGSPAMNMLEATVARANGSFTLDVGKQRLGLDEATLATHPALKSYEGRTVILGIRPEDLEDASLGPDTPPTAARGVVELRESLGSELVVHFTVEGTQLALTEDVKELARTPTWCVPDATEGARSWSAASTCGRGSRSVSPSRWPSTSDPSLLRPETSKGIYGEQTAREREGPK